MLILFDHGTPRGLARSLSGHTVVTAFAVSAATSGSYAEVEIPFS